MVYPCSNKIPGVPGRLVRPVCPVRGLDPVTGEASRNVSDWAECGPDCLLLDYRSNKRWRIENFNVSLL